MRIQWKKPNCITSHPNQEKEKREEEERVAAFKREENKKNKRKKEEAKEERRRIKNIQKQCAREGKRKKEKSGERKKTCWVLSNCGSHNFPNIYKSVIEQCYLKTKNWQDEFSKFSI